MATIDQRLEAATQKAEKASKIMHDVSNGSDTDTVPTESGQVDSLSKWQKDANTLITDNLNSLYQAEEAKRNNKYTLAETTRDNEYTKAEKARDDYFKQEVGDLETAVTSASNSAASAAQSVSEASQIAGLDTLASGVGLLSPRFDVPDFLCSFNNGLRVEHGYTDNRNTHGEPVIDYQRLSDTTSINKSGQLITLASNEPAIESEGIALFDSLTNHVLKSEEYEGYNGATVESNQLDPFGGNSASKITTNKIESGVNPLYSLQMDIGVTTTVSIYLKASTPEGIGKNVKFGILSSKYETIQLTDSYIKYTITSTKDVSGDDTFIIQSAEDSGVTFDLAFVQVKEVS